MNRQSLYFSALQSAARALGEEGLRRRLNVPARVLHAWLVDVLQEREPVRKDR